jgi:hypothetical protein
MPQVGKRYGRTLAASAILGAVLGVCYSLFGDDMLAKLFERAALSATDIFFTGIMGFWVLMCAICIVLFILAAISKELGERTGIFQLLGGGRRGKAALLPMILFYLGNGSLLALLLVAKISGFEATAAPTILGLGILFGAMMIYAGFRCWAVLDELLRGIWIDANAITAGFVLVLGMVATLGEFAGYSIGITGFHAIGIYHGIYLIVNFWLMAVRAPDMITNPMAEEA